MTLKPSVENDLLGSQRPRLSCIPPYVSSSGQEAIELAAMAGLHLDPWEAYVLDQSLGETATGQWAAFEVGLCVPRQNGKGSILEARELAGLFLLDEPLIVHSAHEFATSQEHFRRIKSLVENTPDLMRRVKKNGIKHSHGEEGIELINGHRIRFRTRTKGGARGFTGDLVVFDEAMDIPVAAHGAILPTLSAKSITGNPQVWYTGSAVDQWVHDDGLIFARVRARAIKGDDPALAYFEWSADADDPTGIEDSLMDPAVWAASNPGLGIRISGEHIEREVRSMDPRTAATERMGVGDWPDPSGNKESVIDPARWAAITDDRSTIDGAFRFSFDVAPDRSYSSIGVAGLRADGKRHLEVIKRGRGTAWVAEALAQLTADWATTEPVVCDAIGPAGSLLTQLAALGVPYLEVSAKEHGQACGAFYDGCKEEEDAVRHMDDADLEDAVAGARKRPLGDAWAWSRKHSGVDISPLVAVTLADWGLAQLGAKGSDVPLVAWR